MSDPGRRARVIAHAGALLLGGLTALTATAVHRMTLLGLPVGLLLAVAASLLTAWHLRSGDVPRATSTYCLGWVAVLAVALFGRPEGDFVVAGDLRGYLLMGTGFLLVALGVASLASGPRRAP